MRAETREAPEGKRHLQIQMSIYGGALRRCTNEAVRATRPSEFDSRFRLAEAQCFPQHSGREYGAGPSSEQGLAPRPPRARPPRADGERRVRANES